jgi:hypothetical protein
VHQNQGRITFGMMLCEMQINIVTLNEMIGHLDDVVLYDICEL